MNSSGPKRKQHIVVGISGGVDSAVTALQLAKAGHHLQAVFMQNWQAAPDDPHCTASQDLSDARAVCDQIGIPLQVVDFSKQYWDLVFQRCLDDFAAGFTPNPDILCNSEIKFNYFLQHALDKGADYIATGHYAQCKANADSYELHRGLDNSKDQSYFLHALNPQQLSKAIFPLGEIEKKQVREIAYNAKLINATKSDSTGICFIGERKFKPFLEEYLLAKPGIIEDENGTQVGKHDGLMFYTLGQRKGLLIGGCKGYAELPWYVIEKRQQDNVLVVGQGHQNPKLLSTTLTTKNMHWIKGEPPTEKWPLKCTAQIRYRQKEAECTITPITGENTTTCYRVNFSEPQWAITPGQSIVIYQKTNCLGGAAIASTEKAK
jgi:tRNA-specific 2-thiouridylase